MTFRDEQRNRIYLGESDGTRYGYRRSLKVYAEVGISRQPGEPRTKETVEHGTVTDPFECSVTFSIEKPWKAADKWVCGGAMGEDGLAAVDLWKASADTRDAITRLLPWHLNGMQAGCAHMIPAPVGTVCEWGGFSIGAMDNVTPRDLSVSWSDNGPFAVGLVTGGHDVTLAHYTVNRALVCPVTGYEYGRAWLVCELDAQAWDDLARCGIKLPALTS